MARTRNKYSIAGDPNYPCPSFVPDWFCKFADFETKTEAEQRKLYAEYENAEKYYPSVPLDDGNFVNFYFLQKVQSYAAENTAGYNHINAGNSIVRSFKKGDSFGTALYYKEANPGIWIAFKSFSGGNPVWVYIKDTTIQAKRVYDKGVKNDAQIQNDKNDDEKSWFDKLAEGFGKNVGSGLKWGSAAVAAYLLYDIVKDNKPDKQTSVAGIKGLGLVELGLLSLGAYLLLKDDEQLNKA